MYSVTNLDGTSERMARTKAKVDEVFISAIVQYATSTDNNVDLLISCKLSWLCNSSK
jgi:hypothetical protein